MTTLCVQVSDVSVAPANRQVHLSVQIQQSPVSSERVPVLTRGAEVQTPVEADPCQL